MEFRDRAAAGQILCSRFWRAERHIWRTWGRGQTLLIRCRSRWAEQQLHARPVLFFMGHSVINMGRVPFVLGARPGGRAGSAPASRLALITMKRWHKQLESAHIQSMGSGRFQFSDPHSQGERWKSARGCWVQSCKFADLLQGRRPCIPTDLERGRGAGQLFF